MGSIILVTGVKLVKGGLNMYSSKPIPDAVIGRSNCVGNKILLTILSR